MKNWTSKRCTTGLAAIVLCIMFCYSCKKDNDSFEVNSINYAYTPNSYSPLTGKVEVSTTIPIRTEIKVLGKNGVESDVSHIFPATDTFVVYPILGLYGGSMNTVEVAFYGNNNELLQKESFMIETSALSSELPEITIDVPKRGDIKPGMNLTNSFGYTEKSTPQRPFMFDQFGDIRWYLDYTDHPELGNLFYDVGLIRLKNGNMAFGNANTGKIYEVNMRGTIINTWSLKGYGFHHTVIEKENGNFLVTVSDFFGSTLQDNVLELDRSSGDIVNRWDLKRPLDQYRTTLEGPGNDLSVDWFHANGLAEVPNEDAIIVSGRTQAVVKLNSNNEVIWILAPHTDWRTSALAIDLKQFLLQPLDKNGAPITDSEVLAGTKTHPDFDWNWYQHSPIILPNGNLMIFDNGENRNFGGTGLGAYSRTVEYEIDDANRTIKQVWSYGEDRDDTFSRIVSSVRNHEAENTILFSPGACGPFFVPYGKVVELDKNSKNVLFEATISPKNSLFGITFHSVTRMRLYE